MFNSNTLFILLRTFLSARVEDVLDFSSYTKKDWEALVDMIFNQNVVAISFDGLQKNLEGKEFELDGPELEDLKYEWLAGVVQAETEYDLHCRRVAELTGLFSEDGFRSCILKGLSNALLYPIPSHRHCGDIDIWVEGGRKKVLDYLRKHYKVGKVIINHAKLEIFPDVSVEVHYLPAWLYNPIANRKLQRFFEAESDAQFSNMSDCGFATPLPKFNLVFNAVHIYKHYFHEEFNLKHLVDYYCILQHSTKVERQEAYRILNQVGLGRFTAWLMGRLERDLGLSPELALCPASNSETCHRPLGELLCILPWKVWHWFARKSF